MIVTILLISCSCIIAASIASVVYFARLYRVQPGRKHAKRISKYNMSAADATLVEGSESAFVMYWSRRLRYEMRYPTKPTEANKLVAHSRLAMLWDSPECRITVETKVRYSNRIVCASFVPSLAEIEDSQVCHSIYADKQRDDIVHCVVERYPWPFCLLPGLSTVRRQPVGDF